MVTTDQSPCTDWSRCWCGRLQVDGVKRARLSLDHNTTTPVPYFAARALWAVGQYSTGQPHQVRTARRVCSVGGRSILHGANEARTARHEMQARLPWPFDARAADLSQRWCGRAPAKGVGRSAPHAGPQHNYAKSVLRSACSVGGRPIFLGADSARAARYGIRTRWSQPCKVHAVDMSRWWCG